MERKLTASSRAAVRSAVSEAESQLRDALTRYYLYQRTQSVISGNSSCRPAGAILAEIYNCFTEAFDTADLKDAMALLGELRA